MQKIKNEKGITLVVLVVTIIVISILMGISLSLGTSSLKTSQDDNDEASLAIVQQAVVAQYQKALILEDTGVTYSTSGTQPSVFIGTIIDYTTLTSTYSSVSWVVTAESEIRYYEDCYYLLTVDNLTSLGVENSEDEYIVNYKTGEVYNKTEGTTSEGDLLYIKATDTVTETTVTTDTNFAE